MTSEQVVWFLSFLSLISNASILYLVLMFLLSRFGILSRSWKSILSFFQKRALLCAFIVSLSATLGSLYLSEVAGFEPCKLCWFQRIFMYPLVIITAIAFRKQHNKI